MAFHSINLRRSFKFTQKSNFKFSRGNNILFLNTQNNLTLKNVFFNKIENLSIKGKNVDKY